jgi:plasmid stabilization system protein ParE
MKVDIQLSKEAEKDVLRSFSWYESAKEGLGDEFLEALDFALKAIGENPKAYSFRYKKLVRAYLMDRFPFLIFYVLKKGSVDVISVFHTSQNPKVWKKRI